MYILTILLFTSACSPSSETVAKNTLEEYLELMKNGDRDNASTYLAGTDNLVDVFSYEYLDTLGSNYVKNEIEYSFEMFQKSDDLKKKYNENYFGLINELLDTYGTNEDYEWNYNDQTYDFTLWKKGDYLDSYLFLYDMELANGMGQKVYKKVEFSLLRPKPKHEGDDDTQGDFLITDINIR